jgi:hypothetical protein
VVVTSDHNENSNSDNDCDDTEDDSDKEWKTCDLEHSILLEELREMPHNDYMYTIDYELSKEILEVFSDRSNLNTTTSKAAYEQLTSAQKFGIVSRVVWSLLAKHYN